MKKIYTVMMQGDNNGFAVTYKDHDGRIKQAYDCKIFTEEEMSGKTFDAETVVVPMYFVTTKIPLRGD